VVVPEGTLFRHPDTGDRRFDATDVPFVQNRLAPFDVNGDERVDVVDVAALLHEP